MVFVQYNGRLGNRLFTAALGWILALRADVGLAMPALDLFPMTRQYPIRPWPKSAVQHYPTFTGLRLNPTLEAMVDIAKTDDVLVNRCLFQTDYLLPHQYWLNQLFRPEPGNFLQTEDSDIVLHLRQGDFDRIPAFQYRKEAVCDLLARLSYGRCVIVTDDHSSLFARRLVKEFGGVLARSERGLGYGYDYRTLYHAKRLILTPSTFGWWAAFTGEARDVWMPHEMGLWKACNGVDLAIPGASLYGDDGSEVKSVESVERGA